MIIFRWKIEIFFLNIAQTIDRGYTLEPPDVISNISEMKTLMPCCYTDAHNTTGTMEFSRENADQGADEYTLDIFFLMGKYTFV